MMGEGKLEGATRFFNNYLHATFEVAGAAMLDGRLYRKSGAEFPVIVYALGPRLENPLSAERAKKIPDELPYLHTTDQLFAWGDAARLAMDEIMARRSAPDTRVARTFVAPDFDDADITTDETPHGDVPAALGPAVPPGGPGVEGPGFEAGRGDEPWRAGGGGGEPFGAFRRAGGGGGPGGMHFEFRSAGPGGGHAGDPFAGEAGDIFSELFGQSFKRQAGGAQPRQQAGADVNVTMDVTVEEAATAAKVTAVFPDGHKLNIKLPAYVEDGQTIRLKGQGQASPFGQPGDALVKVRFRKHPVYRLEGRDLPADVPVPLADAVLGAKVAVETPYGRLAVSIPAWSSSDRKLRLKGKGLPLKGGGHGDLYAHVRIMLPEGGDAELESLMRQTKEGTGGRARHS